MPDAHLTDNDFDSHTDRRIWVKLEGSLRDLQRGTVSSVWKADTENIYRRITGTDYMNPQFEGDVEKGIVIAMNLHLVTSTFPVDVGAIVSNVHGKEFMKSGRNYAFIVPRKNTVTFNQPIFEPASKVTRELLQRHNDASAARLSDDYSRFASGKAHVRNLSPLGKMIRRHATDLAMTFACSAEEDKWFECTGAIVDKCLKAYEEYQNVNFQNMADFKIAFERVDAPPGEWAQEKGVIDRMLRSRTGEKGRHAADARLNTPFTLMAQIGMKLVLYGKDGNPIM